MEVWRGVQYGVLAGWYVDDDNNNVIMGCTDTVVVMLVVHGYNLTITMQPNNYCIICVSARTMRGLILSAIINLI